MFNLDLQKLANACASCRQEPNDKVPISFCRIVQLSLEVDVVLIADDIFEKWLLLDPNETKLQFRLPNANGIAVQSQQANVDGLWLEILHKIGLVESKVLLCHLAVERCELSCRIKIRRDRVFGLVCFPQKRGIVFDVYHSHSFQWIYYDRKRNGY